MKKQRRHLVVRAVRVRRRWMLQDMSTSYLVDCHWLLAADSSPEWTRTLALQLSSAHAHIHTHAHAGQQQQQQRLASTAEHNNDVKCYRCETQPLWGVDVCWIQVDWCSSTVHTVYTTHGPYRTHQCEKNWHDKA